MFINKPVASVDKVYSPNIHRIFEGIFGILNADRCYVCVRHFVSAVGDRVVCMCGVGAYAQYVAATQTSL
eukprot:8369494-Pyramimonas_sp.AAC.1